MSEATATPNIALIKYWGNRHNQWRLPSAHSLSMTLDGPYAKVSIQPAEVFSVTSKTKQLTTEDSQRFFQTIERIDTYVSSTLHHNPPSPQSYSLHIESDIPAGIGLASSAAVFAALAKAYSGLLNTKFTQEQLSVMARLGSGSAARSIMGGFVSLENIHDSIDGAIAKRIATADHWPLYDCVLAPTQQHKSTTSSVGHQSAHTSPYFQERISDITHRRQQEAIDAITQKDFEKLQHVAEEDCLNMHNVMRTQYPPLHYLSPITHRLIQDITTLRKEQHIPLLYTMDAGPTVHLIYPEEARSAVLQFAAQQTDCTVFDLTIGEDR